MDLDTPSRTVLHAAREGIVGVVEILEGADGVVFQRSRADAMRWLADRPLFTTHSRIPSGVRLEAATNAKQLELELHLTRFLEAGADSPGTVFDVVVDGVRREPIVLADETIVRIDPLTLEESRTQPQGAATLKIALDGREAEHDVQIWFPCTTQVALADVRVSEGASFRPAAQRQPAWVHYGSSISQCLEAARPTETWPAAVARKTGHSLLNLAIAGECHLDQFVARCIRDTPAQLISLELGINVVNADSMRDRTFISAFHGFLDTIRDGHPETPIVILTPIICPIAEDCPGPTQRQPGGAYQAVPRPRALSEGALDVSRIRELLNHHVGLRQEQGDTNLGLVNGLELFGPDDLGDMPDNLHPTAAGYLRIADRFAHRVFSPQEIRPGMKPINGELGPVALSPRLRPRTVSAAQPADPEGSDA